MHREVECPIFEWEIARTVSDSRKKITIRIKMQTIASSCHDNTWLLVIILILQLLFVILLIVFVVGPVVRVEKTIKSIVLDVENAIGKITSTIGDVKSAICDFLPTLPICRT